jgi:hypothetical protein
MFEGKLPKDHYQYTDVKFTFLCSNELCKIHLELNP